MSDVHKYKERFERKIEAGRIYKLLYSVLTLEKILGKDFQQAEKEDLKELIRKIENSPKNYTENTKKDFRAVIKKFYKFLNGNEEYPDKVRADFSKRYETGCLKLQYPVCCVYFAFCEVIGA